MHTRQVKRWYCYGLDGSLVDGPYLTMSEAIKAMQSEGGYKRHPNWYSVTSEITDLTTVDGEFNSVPGWQVESAIRKADYMAAGYHDVKEEK